MITQRMKKEMLKTERTASFPYLIHIHNDDLGDFYYANYFKDIVYNGQTYTASSFQLDPPDKTQSQIGNASLTFTVADGLWIQKIRETQKRSTLEFVALIIYEGDVIEEIDDNSFVLTSASWNDNTIKWELVFDENMDVLIPCDIMNSLTVSGCV